MKVIATIATLFLTTSSAWAQTLEIGAGPNGLRMNIDPGAAGQRAEVQRTQTMEQSGEGYRVRYQTHPQGDTVMEILEPQGAHVEITDGFMVLKSEEIPVSFHAVPDKFYKFAIRTRSGAAWDRKFQSTEGMTGTVWAPQPSVPTMITTVASFANSARPIRTSPTVNPPRTRTGPRSAARFAK